ncbi:MAG TPA: hypothetical protein DCF68_13985 [Cyanothece sp. UBA12306]|nr:hypothetical protein [Cyanothece sp. UBA12306]
MRVWVTTVCLLFLLIQVYQWIRGFILPLPIYVLAGAFLAIASNYEKGLGTLFKMGSTQLNFGKEKESE